ncbi:hypothetical protein M407DRAFT_78451 [Tulasnella calospora MUT 4182]|uniref:NAD(P)-binding protein n=1 Tax=Tulasnella calospora MUT 4182 TaxID=1051891 RepID=A0A0C3LNX1_9AGAM|nr:hypothetical protein M407DRAFT_78451 [Tulasnella calospora MUT 4182]
MSTTTQNEQYLSQHPEPQYHKGTGQQSAMRPSPVDDTLHDGSPYKAAGKLDGKKAIITGADSGIGRATALLFALEGADLTLHYLEEEEQDIQSTLSLIRERAPKVALHTIALDLTKKDNCDQLVKSHVDKFGTVDALVLNHGTQDVKKEFSDISADQWLNTFNVNIHPHFFITQAALPHMKQGSTISMNASVNHFKGHPMLIDYTATKGAMVGFARALSNALVGKKGIRVNVVAPGPIWTPLITATMPKESQEGFGENVPMGRPGQPVEVATCFVFLASPDSGYISGQVLHPNGGNVIA